MDIKENKPAACIQCEAIVLAVRRVIDDWHATCDMGVILNDNNRIDWTSLHQLESLLKSK